MRSNKQTTTPLHLLLAAHARTPALRWVFGLLLFTVLLLGAWRHFQLPTVPPARFVTVIGTEDTWVNTLPNTSSSSSANTHPIALQARGLVDLPMPPNMPAAHASFLVQQGEQTHCVWFAGARESAADVQIVMSTLDKTSQTWSAPKVVVNRKVAGARIHSWIRRIGNPVAWVDRQGLLHLYVVATSGGGWASSRILHLRQSRIGGDIRPVGILPLTPLANLGVLVRTQLVDLEDGGAILPAYFEIGVKYPLAVRVDAQGDFVSATPMSRDRVTLQPAIVPHSAAQAIAYLRDNSAEQRLRVLQTQDAGLSWQDFRPQPVMVNPDSSVAARRLADGSTLLVHNPNKEGRQKLVISRSKDGLHDWQTVAVLEDHLEPSAPTTKPTSATFYNEYSYPSILVLGDKLSVSYTYQRRFIRVANFDLTAAQS